MTLDPEKALGIEDLIPSYHILYSEPSQLSLPIANNGIDIKNFPKQKDVKFSSTGKMLQNPTLLSYVQNNAEGKADILVFKNDEAVSKNASSSNLNLINPDYKLNLKLENKIEFAGFVDTLDFFEQPEYEIFEKLSDVDFASVSQRYGSNFVVQFIFGHSGSTTFFIESEEYLNQLKQTYPERKTKISRNINGFPYTVNACITKAGIVIGGISEQITGVKELTSSKGGTVGNDYSQRHLDENLRREIVERTMKMGEVLKSQGHRGIFGLDFIVEKETGRLLLIEANIRQTASSGYTSYLQRMNKQVPIMLWHVLELLDFDFSQRFDCLDDLEEEWINETIQSFLNSPDKVAWNISMNQPIHASQVFFRNIQNYPVQILEQFPAGIYRIRGRMPSESADLEDGQDYPAIFRMREDGWSTLCLIQRGYNIIEAAAEQGFLILAAPEKGEIQPLGELGRIQFLESAFATKDGNDLSGWLVDVINCIYENMRTMKADSQV